MSEMPSARTTDLDTSHRAGDRARERAPIIRTVIMEIMDGSEPLTHDEIIARYRLRMVTDPSTPPASDSGIRTRVSELRKAGLVVLDPTEGLSTYGNRAKRWVTPQWLVQHADPLPVDDVPTDTVTSANPTLPVSAAIDAESFIPFVGS